MVWWARSLFVAFIFLLQGGIGVVMTIVDCMYNKPNVAKAGIDVLREDGGRPVLVPIA